MAFQQRTRKQLVMFVRISPSLAKSPSCRADPAVRAGSMSKNPQPANVSPASQPQPASRASHLGGENPGDAALGMRSGHIMIGPSTDHALIKCTIAHRNCPSSWPLLQVTYLEQSEGCRRFEVPLASTHRRLLTGSRATQSGKIREHRRPGPQHFRSFMATCRFAH
jgi:hypothetical protein